MKIICTKEEFVELVRSCEGTLNIGDCYDCVFSAVCSHGCSVAIRRMDFIEDICELEE